ASTAKFAWLGHSRSTLSSQLLPRVGHVSRATSVATTSRPPSKENVDFSESTPIVAASCFYSTSPALPSTCRSLQRTAFSLTLLICLLLPLRTSSTSAHTPTASASFYRR
ncbi:hypothetical protein C8F01DRAFT_1374178, partial [Mycena amicta]